MLISILAVASCISCTTQKSVQPYTAAQDEAARAAIRELMAQTAATAPATLFAIRPALSDIETYIPKNSESLVSYLYVIPGLQGYASQWLDEVYNACSTVAAEIPTMLAQDIANVPIPNAQAVVLGSKTAATTLLDNYCSASLETAVQERLKSYMAGNIDALWKLMTTLYGIWRTAQENIAPISSVHVPPAIAGDLAQHLAVFICDAFFTQMGNDELAVRTTRIPNDKSLVSQVFRP